jgi:prepilin-type N-terminal cleavage/methylation domain-containing protein/prepilin-type processing-associated H-X9-DG protein
MEDPVMRTDTHAGFRQPAGPGGPGLRCRRAAPGRCAAGFTLVELLVVVGIISVLMAIMLPSLRGAREQARRVVCASNQRQLIAGLLSYGNENRGHLPPHDIGINPFINNWVRETGNIGARATYPEPLPDGSGGVWLGMGFLYALNYIPTPEAYYCPSVKVDILTYPDGWERGVSAVSSQKVAGFSYRGFGQGPPYTISLREFDNEFRRLKLGRLKSPKALISDVAVFPQWYGSTASRFLWPHEYGLNVSYADGHVEYRNLGKAEYERAHRHTQQFWIADAYIPLLWFGLDEGNFQRLQASFP